MIAVNNHSNNSMKELNDDLQAKASSDMDGKNGNSSSTVVVVSQPAQETKRKGTSELETIMHIIKANIGTGVLAMPYAFNCGGLVLSSVSIWIMAVIAIHCMHILIDLYKYVMASSANDPSKKVSDTISYDEVVELAMRERLQRSSSPSGLFSANSNLPKYCRLFVSAFIIMAQLGGCCVYLIFIPTNIKQVIDFYNPVDKWSLKLVMTCVVLPLAAFCLVKSLKVLAPFSALANTLMLSSMLVIIYELVSGTLKPFDQLDLVAPVSKLPLFYSTAIYAFEGIPLVLPVHHEMKSKVNYTPWNGVLNTGMFMVAAMYFSIGFYGYLKYGHDSKASITLNLPVEDVRCFYCCCCYCFLLLLFGVGLSFSTKLFLNATKGTFSNNQNLLRRGHFHLVQLAVRRRCRHPVEKRAALELHNTVAHAEQAVVGRVALSSRTCGTHVRACRQHTADKFVYFAHWCRDRLVSCLTHTADA